MFAASASLHADDVLSGCRGGGHRSCRDGSLFLNWAVWRSLCFVTKRRAGVKNGGCWPGVGALSTWSTPFFFQHLGLISSGGFQCLGLVLAVLDCKNRHFLLSLVFPIVFSLLR